MSQPRLPIWTDAVTAAGLVALIAAHVAAPSDGVWWAVVVPVAAIVAIATLTSVTARRAQVRRERALHTQLDRLQQRAQDAELATERATRTEADAQQLLAGISHDLRSPLNGIVGMADALVHQDLPDGQRHSARVLLQAGEDMRRMVDTLVAGRGTATDPPDLHVDETCPDALTQHVIDLFAHTATDLDVRLTYRAEPGVPDKVLVQAHHVRSVLYRLVDYAVSHASKHPVAVRMTFADGQLCWTIDHKGVALAAEQQRSLFHMPSQAPDTLHRSGDLGLATARNLVDSLHGALEVEQPTTSSSVLSLRIPARRIPTSPSLQLAVDPDCARILLVDDIEINRMICRQFLGRLGLNVHEAVNGKEAVEMASKYAYNAILMDVQMPVMDGYEATRQIKEMLGTQAPPILAITANVLPEDREQCLRSGMVEHLGKPLHLASLQRVLSQWIPLSAP